LGFLGLLCVQIFEKLKELASNLGRLTIDCIFSHLSSTNFFIFFVKPTVFNFFRWNNSSHLPLGKTYNLGCFFQQWGFVGSFCCCNRGIFSTFFEEFEAISNHLVFNQLYLRVSDFFRPSIQLPRQIFRGCHLNFRRIFFDDGILLTSGWRVNLELSDEH
jgi:hypothetical protein